MIARELVAHAARNVTSARADGITIGSVAGEKKAAVRPSTIILI
jgi:hypothetical protein